MMVVVTSDQGSEEFKFVGKEEGDLSSLIVHHTFVLNNMFGEAESIEGTHGYLCFM